MGPHLGSTAPDFEHDPSEGKLKFHEWRGDEQPVSPRGHGGNPPRQDGEPPDARLGRGIGAC
jgi:hypothetical protein